MSAANADRRSGASGLFVVATPIGHLSDITLRAVETLKQVQFVVAEDTRRARQLLSHLGIGSKQVLCVDAHASERQLDQVAERIASGESCAMVTDAGMPSVSDPGSALVAACRARDVPIVVIPGPSAVTAALAVSGFDVSGFWFVGFLPRKGEKRERAVQEICQFTSAVVLFEAPTRVQETLQELALSMPTRPICVARELTKQFEEVRVAPLAEWAKTEREWRGELTLVLGPSDDLKADPIASADLDLLIAPRLAQGQSPRTVAEELAPLLTVPRRTIYQRALQLRGER